MKHAKQTKHQKWIKENLWRFEPPPKYQMDKERMYILLDKIPTELTDKELIFLETQIDSKNVKNDYRVKNVKIEIEHRKSKLPINSKKFILVKNYKSKKLKQKVLENQTQINFKEFKI